MCFYQILASVWGGWYTDGKQTSGHFINSLEGSWSLQGSFTWVMWSLSGFMWCISHMYFLSNNAYWNKVMVVPLSNLKVPFSSHFSFWQCIYINKVWYDNKVRMISLLVYGHKEQVHPKMKAPEVLRSQICLKRHVLHSWLMAGLI